MDYKYIEQLAERYFLAETTLQEEQILRTFFAQADDDLPDTLAAYAPLFAAMRQEERLGDDFDERILALTGQAQGDDATDAADVPLRVTARTVRLSQRLRPLFKAAAVVAILLTLGNAINQSFTAVDVWADEAVYADSQTADDGSALAIDGLSADSATLLGQAQLGDSVRVDSIARQY